MPHLILEYTKNLNALDEQGVLLRLNKALFESGQFDEIDIKSRAVALDDFVIGITPGGRAFAHAKLALSSGRSPAVKRDLSNALLQELRSIFSGPSKHHIQLCAEIIDIDRDSYAKDIILPSS
jgi:5-carboxymethyl-2-hydroxymuconate isomerase